MADEGCGHADEGEEVLGLAFVAAVQAAAARTQSVRRPSGAGRAGRRTRHPCGRCGGVCRARAAIAAGDRSLVRMQFPGSPAATSTAGTDRRDSADERFQALAVVHVGAGDTQRQRQPVPIGDQMNFRPQLATVGRIRSRQKAPFAARTLTESIAHRDQSSSPRAPSSSRTTRWRLAHTRSSLHWENRR